MNESVFEEKVKEARVPVLVLDQKWHRLFALARKPDEVKTLEAEINDLLQKQAKAAEDEKKLKKEKEILLKQIRENMGGADSENASEEETKNFEDTKRLLDETSEKLEAVQDDVLDIPREIKQKNDELMLLTMKFAYDKLRSNTEEINEISSWIADVRVNLKKNIIKKQNREINNKEMYAYMHDLFGKDVMKMFDLHFDKDGKLITKEHYEEEQINAAKGGEKELMNT